MNSEQLKKFRFVKAQLKDVEQICLVHIAAVRVLVQMIIRLTK